MATRVVVPVVGWGMTASVGFRGGAIEEPSQSVGLKGVPHGGVRRDWWNSSCKLLERAFQLGTVRAYW
jgi:hypothetical protein